MNNITITRNTDNTIIQTFHINKKMSLDEIRNMVTSAITLEFYVNFGKNFTVEFDNLMLSTNDIVTAIDTIRNMPVPIRNKIPRVFESSTQIYELTQIQYIYNFD